MAAPSFDRQVKVSCPKLSPPHELLFRSMTGKDGLSELFEYRVELLSTSPNVPMAEVLGYPMTISLELPLPPKAPPARRFFNGYVSSFHFLRLEGEFTVYSAVLRPQMWLLTRNQDCRVWEDKTVLAVVKSVFDLYGFQCDSETFVSADRGDEYKRREYCVQYNETDFNFVSRLLEEEGIHYFFEHSDGKHKLLLADSLMGHVPTEGYGTIPFSLPDRRSDRDVEAITSWSVHQSVEADHCGVGDFDFTDPRLEKVSAKGTSVSVRDHGRAGHFERYQYPEPIVKMKDYGATMAETLAKIRAQEIHAQWEVIEGACNARGLVVGAGFGISGHPREEFNKPGFLLSHARFSLHSGDYRSTADATKALTYSCSFNAINVQNTFRPARLTPKPSIPGPQTAIVIGPAGVPIHTDKFGRVKVAFPWTRPQTKDKSSPSCWVRVSQAWAGQDWGSMQLPHVGHEVIVSFLDGDPDRPIVTGRVYNGKNPPWQKLPDHATRSYISDQVGNRIVMQSKEEEKGISIHTPSMDTHLWLGYQDGLELPDVRQEAMQRVAGAVSEKLGESVTVDLQRGGVVTDTVGDISQHSEGSFFGVSEMDHVSLVGGNAIRVEEKDSFHVTKGMYKRIDGNRHETVEGATTVIQTKAAVNINLSLLAHFNLAATATVTTGAALSVSRAFKIDYAKDKKHDLTKNNIMTAQSEHRFQVSAIPAIQEASAKKFLGMRSGFPQGAFDGLLKKKENAPKADAEMILKPDQVMIRCANTAITIGKDGTVVINAPKGKVKMKTEEVEIASAKKFTVNGKTVNLKAPTVHAGKNFTAKD